MPEVIRTFTTGKMNKDLDERLVPNGEYRDALNLEISTSDNGNVGALQNIDGNTAKLNKFLNPSTGVYTPWTSGYINTLINPKVIGQIKDSVTENIYWFIASDGISAIAEYNQINDVVVPVLVDTQNILNFSDSYLITGINIIEDLLFFTDNQTEPKGLNIKDFKESTPDFQTHSVINGRDFIEEDITVIKKAPLVAPTLDLARTRAVDNEGNEAIVETTTVQNFIVQDTNDPCINEPQCRIPAPLGTEFTLNWVTTPYPFYRASDVLVLIGTAPMGTDDGTVGELAEYKVRVEVISVPPVNTQTNATVKVLAVPETVPDQDITWEVSLEELPFFEFKFPRFAFRYKYKDGYYSTFSPFTEIAFLPGEFDYETRKGYNLGMVNELKQCVIKDFVPDDIPPDVVEVDLLYKESNSQSVYVVDTFKKDDDIWNEGGPNGNGFKVESEIISSILPGNQILRPYDNVPRKAKAQEITGNRLIYGNYLQNFNLKNELGIEVSPTLTQSIVHNSNWDVVDGVHTQTDIGEPIPKTPFKSIKTQRTYQAGVVFQGKYGRQTPVFTSESAAITLAKGEADKYNQIVVQTDGNAPVGFTHFKYYIKEPSNEYYNLAMDRHYDAEDGNVWISFPSAERNKVQEDTFLEIKKKHDSDEFISAPAKYKVIAIKNEAPLFLRKQINSAGSIEDGGNDIKDTGVPQPNRTWIDIDKDTFEDSSASVALDTTDKQRLVRVFSTSAVSDYYNVASISLPSGSDYYRIAIEKKFGEDMAFTVDENGNKQPGLSVELSFENFVDKPEFEGRFFVKLEKDTTLEEYILSDANNDNFAIGSTVRLGYVSKAMGRSAINDTFGGGSFFIDAGPVRNNNDDYPNNCTVSNKYCGKGIIQGGGNVAGTLSIAFSGIWDSGGDFGVGRTLYPQYRDQVKTLMSDGGLFRFTDDPDQIVYKIVETEEVSRLRNYKANKKHEKYNKGSNKRTRWDLRVEPVDPNDSSKLQGPYPNKGLFQGINDNNGAWRSHFSGSGVAREPGPELEFLKPFFEENSFTSDNPAIFETEPKETAELELFYAASEAYPISEYGNAHTLGWHNCYSFANGVESDRIRDDFNAVTVDNGPIVSSTLKEPYAEERRATGLIFSQIFNSISGVNSLNQFIQAEAITKDLNPIYGSIQKLHTRDTNLVTLCEDKCLRILTNKDALFNADGNANVTSNNAVLGQATPYVGEFGISLHPESFATYGFRAYFTDKNRGVVLRLSADGLEEISRYGMSDFFADNLKESNITWGSYDDDKGGYNISLDNIATEWRDKFKDRIYINGNWNEFSTTHSVVTFKESTNGWESRKAFSPEGGISLNDRYYTFDKGNIWEHRTDSSVKNNFYGVQYDSSVTFLINEQPNTVKKYKTLNYSGSKSRAYVYGDGVYEGLSLAEVEALQLQNITNQTLKNEGWFTEYINTDLQEGYIKEFLDKENKWFQYIKGEATYFSTNSDNNLDSREFSMQGIGRASAVSAPDISAFNVRIFGDPSCAVYIQDPTADPKTYSVAEDCTNCGELILTGTDPQGLALTFEIVSDNTQNGTLSAISGNQITFTPNVANYYGSAGTFTYRSYNGTRYSAPATVTVTITSVAEPPQITSTPDPAQLNQTVGQTFTYANITASDPDHNPLTDLSWSTNNLPQGWTLTTTGDGFTGIATITGTVAQGDTTFEVVVTDPDGLTDTQEIVVGGIAAALLDLDFIAHSGMAQPAQTWTDPTDSTFVVPMQAKAQSSHGCARGTYRLVANKHINGGVVIGRFYVGNTPGNNSLYDSFTYDTSGHPNSLTGDPTYIQVASANSQGNTDSLGNVSTLMYDVGSVEFGTDPNNSLQKYVTAAMANNKYYTSGGTDRTRYSYLKMTPAQAQTIADNYPDTYDNCYVTFTFEPDTYNAGGNFNTHADSVGFQVVQKGSTQGYQGGPEIYSDKLGVATGTCTAGQPCPPETWPYITFNVCTGEYIDTYDPLNPPSQPY